MITAGFPPVALLPGVIMQVEKCFQAVKNEAGLDHYQVRPYDAWYRHITRPTRPCFPAATTPTAPRQRS